MPMELRIQKRKVACSTCSARSVSWLMPILSSMRSSERPALIRRMFSIVSWVEACSSSSAFCIRLWRVFNGRLNAMTSARPARPPITMTNTKRQSMEIRMAAAPKKESTSPTIFGSRRITPPLITDMSENTRLTSSPL